MSRCGANLTRPVPATWGTACQQCGRGPDQPIPREPGTLHPRPTEPDLPLKVRPVQAVS